MNKTKVLLRIVFIFITCFTLFISSVYIYIAVRGKDLIENNLEKFFKKEVRIDSLKVTLPLNITVSNIKIKDLGNIDFIHMRTSLFGFLAARVTINSVIVNKPNFSFERKKQELIISVAPDLSSNAKGTEKQKAKKNQFKLTIPLFIKDLKIVDAKINMLDKTVGDVPIKITAESVNFSLINFCLPARNIKTHYNINGVIPWEGIHKAGEIDGQGWINFDNKGMDGQINFRDIDGKYLAPYYVNFISLEELNVERTSLDFLTTLSSHNNDMLIRSHLELKNLVFRKQKDAKENSKDESLHKIMGAVFEVFTSVGGKIVLDFTVKTKFDKPRMGLENIKVSIEDKFSKKILN